LEKLVTDHGTSIRLADAITQRLTNKCRLENRPRLNKQEAISAVTGESDETSATQGATPLEGRSRGEAKNKLKLKKNRKTCRSFVHMIFKTFQDSECVQPYQVKANCIS